MALGLDTVANFVWGFGQEFLLIVKDKEFYVWSAPDYNGDNTIKPYNGNASDFTSPGFCGRDKGIHSIGSYCGDAVKFMNC